MQTNNLGLVIPEQTTNKSTKDLSLDAITTWCSHLQQITENKEITQSIITMLKDLNCTTITVEHRFQALEMLKPISQSIYQTQKKQYINRIKPLYKDKINTIEDCRTIQNELLIGYKIIIQNLANKTASATDKEILPLSIYQIFNISSNILLSYYQLYADEPANIWKELHIIYQYAESCNLLEYSINIEANKKSLIIQPYKKVLFLAAIKPYQWRQNEQELLYKYADIWNEFIVIRSFRSKDQKENEGLFFIPTQEDAAPFPIDANKPITQESGWVLDLSKLINYLKNNKSIDPQETEITKHSLQKLIVYLLTGPKRNLDRFNILGQISIAFGLLSTHYHINKKKLFKPEQVDSTDTDDNIQEFQLSSDTVLEDFGKTNNNEQEFKADTFLYNCNLLNIHGEGAAITFKDMSYPPIQPGELFAMTINIKDEIDLDETHWNIGTLRWLKHDNQHKLTAGLQILAPFAIAAGVQLLKKDGNSSGYFQRALLFKDNNEDFFHLITPIMQFELNKQVKIYSYYHKEFVDVELKKQIDSDSYFKHFLIEPKFTNTSIK